MTARSEASAPRPAGDVDAGPDDLIAVYVPAGVVDVASLVGRGARAVFDGADGPGGGPILAGFGEAARITGAGDARWDAIARGASALFASLRGPAARDVRLLGGVAFQPRNAASPGGAGAGEGGDELGDAVFSLPRWTWIADRRGVRAIFVGRARELGGTALADEAAGVFGVRPEATVVASHSPQASPAQPIDDGARAFVSRVEAACAAIDAGVLEKVVVGRRVELDLGGPSDVDATWRALRAREPGTIRLAWRDGESSLLAATPERLVVREGGRVVIDALAGTIARTGDDEAAVAELLASDKDRREHDVVVKAIAETVRDLGGEARFADVPKARTLRALHHLSTEVEASFASPPSALRLAAKLHPTPAVAGTPRAAAAAFLRERESQRGWFTGAFGWLDPTGDGAFAVILRALILRGSRAHLFAGTGIVRGSEPARELAETEAKLRAARGALGLEASA